MVLETAGLNATELSAYCRERGLFHEHVERWRSASLDANEKPPVNRDRKLSPSQLRWQWLPDQQQRRHLSWQYQAADQATFVDSTLIRSALVDQTLSIDDLDPGN